MKNLILAFAFAGAGSVPAFSQDLAAALVCADYSKMDNTHQMAVVAELESAASQMDTKLSANEIYAGLSQECTAHPDKLVTDAVKEIKKM